MVRYSRRLLSLLSLSLGMLSVLPVAQAADGLFELRIFSAQPGKLPELQKLFGTTAVPLLAKGGSRNLFTSTVLEAAPSDNGDGPNMLICIVEHSGRDGAEQAWKAVETASAWQSGAQLLARAPVSIYMTPTDFSPRLEAVASTGTPRLFELRKYNTGAEGLPRTLEQFRSGLAGIIEKNGMRPVMYWAAEDRSSFVYLLAHKDRESARNSWASFIADYRPFMAEFNVKFPAPAGNRTPDDNRFLIATEYSPLK